MSYLRKKNLKKGPSKSKIIEKLKIIAIMQLNIRGAADSQGFQLGFQWQEKQILW